MWGILFLFMNVKQTGTGVGWLAILRVLNKCRDF
jgi:hypothetical protein